MMPYASFTDICAQLVKYPFRTKPCYLEGVWGGSYMKEHRNLPKEMRNAAWVFDFIPMEVSVLVEVGSFIGQNIKDRLKEYHIECLLFGGQISRSFRFMEEAVREELKEIDGLTINTVSDFSNAAFKGLAEMLNVLIPNID